MRRSWAYFATFSLLVVWASCSDDDDRHVDTSSGAGLADQTGEACAVANDCFTDVTAGEIAGDVQCLDRVDGGYCTHLCESDDDCCAVDGECDPGDTQVCGPFESTGMMMCFISCDDGDFEGDADTFCAGYHPDFICRSTGGGSSNRKVCVPSGNGPCAAISDCPDGFVNCCENTLGDLRCYDDASADGRTCL